MQKSDIDTGGSQSIYSHDIWMRDVLLGDISSKLSINPNPFGRKSRSAKES